MAMTILLDTHVWIWMVSSPERLSAHVRRHISREGNERLLSAASAWEMSIKFSKGKLTLPDAPASFIPRLLALTKTTPLPILHSHATRVADLPHHHRDPFDRILIAQAMVENIPIITADARFAKYNIKVIKAN